MIEVGRRPVLVLWGTIVAERLGFERDEALTLGRALVSLGGRMTDPPPEVLTPAKIAQRRDELYPGQTIDVAFIDRVVCMTKAPEGLRAVVKNQPIDPASVEQYLGEKFGDHIDSVAAAMISLAETLPPSQLIECALDLYERFRPETNELDIDQITASISSNPREEALTEAEWMNDSSWEDAHGEMPSFRGPNAITSRAIGSNRVEPVPRERTAFHAPRAPRQIADASVTKSRKWVIEPSMPSRSEFARPAVASATRPIVTRTIAAPMWPLVLLLSVFLASTIGGGIGALLVAPPQQASVMGELRGLLASYLPSASPPSPLSELESPAAYSDPSASFSRSESLAVAISTTPSNPEGRTPEYLPVDNQGVPAVARVRSRDEAPRGAPIAVETSATPANPVNETPEYPRVDKAGASEAARIESGDEAPRSAPIAVDMSTAPANLANGTPEDHPIDNSGASDIRIESGDGARSSSPIAVETSATSSNPVPRTPESPPVNNHGASDVARIAMARGDERMRQGDVASARRFYEMAATTGMIEAATAIGRTFDPLYLRRIGVRGALADARRAKQWYEKAAQAGDMEAQARIELMTFERASR